jgi:hypothetical protein
VGTEGTEVAAALAGWRTAERALEDARGVRDHAEPSELEEAIISERRAGERDDEAKRAYHDAEARARDALTADRGNPTPPIPAR